MSFLGPISDWWQWKVELNRQRDSSTDADLTATGWQVIRVWEHTDPEEAAASVMGVYIARLRDAASSRSGPR